MPSEEEYAEKMGELIGRMSSRSSNAGESSAQWLEGLKAMSIRLDEEMDAVKADIRAQEREGKDR